MRCYKCHHVFEPSENAKLGVFDGDAAQVQTVCPHCRVGYYTFTRADWVSEDAAHALIRATNHQTQEAA